MEIKVDINKNIRLIAVDRKTGEQVEIDDLYWFEENYVHDFDDERYRFYIELTLDKGII